MATVAQKLYDAFGSSGAFSASSQRDSAVDLHSYLSSAIARLPKAYQPGTAWHTWQPGTSILSTDSQVILAIILYLTTIFGGRQLMKGSKPFKFARLFQIHNALLSAASGLLLVLMLQEIIPVIYKHGFFYAICNHGAWTSRMETYYMINYYFKYWEFVDTMFLVVKKKPLAFLHVYHHSATALLCYTQLNGGTSISWTVITLNLAVHTIMYYYYLVTALGYRPWWKRAVTIGQITQFVLDLNLVYFGTYNHFVYKFMPRLPHLGDCAGSEYAALQGCGILTSYLFLFIAFYRKTYDKKASKQLNTRQTAKVGTAEKAATELLEETCSPDQQIARSVPGSGANTPTLAKPQNGFH